MKGEYGHLDGKGYEDEPKKPHLRTGRKGRPCSYYISPGIAAHALRLHRQVYEARKHHQAAHKGVNEELESNGYALFATPFRTQKVYRYQRQFPEYIEHKRIISQEHTHKASLRQQQETIERTRLFYLLIHIHDHYHCHHYPGEQAQHTAHAIAHQAEMCTQYRYPIVYIRYGTRIVHTTHINRNGQREYRADKRKHLSAIPLHSKGEDA